MRYAVLPRLSPRSSFYQYGVSLSDAQISARANRGIAGRRYGTAVIARTGPEERGKLYAVLRGREASSFNSYVCGRRPPIGIEGEEER